MSGASLTRRAVVLVAVLVTVAMNYAVEAFRFFGRSTADVSSRYQTLFTPAGFTFAIWGLIYLALVAYAVAQFLPPLRDSELPDALWLPLTVSSAANVSWLVLWHALAIPWTVVAMAALLGSLIAAYLIARSRPPRDLTERVLVRGTTSLYLGWVSVATIANVAVLLVYLHWNGWGIGPRVWAVAMVWVAVALAVAALALRRDYVFAAVIAWALVGITVGQAARPVVAVGAAFAEGAVLAAMAVTAVLAYRRSHGAA